ncbi:hypothetical protein E4T56_gene3432 [Termitomyces sp. T112]|nr:hypothetical protein E4T56_gene3432 [Termitomyces sp. T112]
MSTLFLLWPQLLWNSQIIIPPLDCHFLLKSLLPLDSNELKPTSSSMTKSSASSASPLWSLQDVLMPALLAWVTMIPQQIWRFRQITSSTSTNAIYKEPFPKLCKALWELMPISKTSFTLLAPSICNEKNPPEYKAIPHQQEELNAVSNILRDLNPAGELFDQPAAHTLVLSAHLRANSIPSTFCTWDQCATPEPYIQRPPSYIDNDNQILSYIDKPGNLSKEPAPYNGIPGPP